MAPLEPLDLWPCPISTYLQGIETADDGVAYLQLRPYGRFNRDPGLIEFAVRAPGDTHPRYAFVRVRARSASSSIDRPFAALRRAREQASLWLASDMRDAVADFGV